MSSIVGGIEAHSQSISERDERDSVLACYVTKPLSPLRAFINLQIGDKGHRPPLLAGRAVREILRPGVSEHLF